MVSLPEDLECIDCSLRLVRQASEWGKKYLFWSCADVDILPPRDFLQTCSGHGRAFNGRCRCNRLYYGDACQYQDECLKHEDCGGHGKCWDIEATSAPRKQCYCETGFFGAGCSKRSPIKSKKVQLGLYTKKEVSEKLTLYWRILKEDQEIEMVLKMNGTSYAAVGWRPKGLTASCKKFPVLADQEPVARSLDLKNYPKTKSEGSEAEPEPESEPKAEPESEPEADSQPAVAAQIQPREGRAKSLKNKRMSTRTDVGISFVMSSVSSSRRKREAARHGRAFAIPLNDREENTSSAQGENFVYKFY